jgi:hypothetical protein
MKLFITHKRVAQKGTFVQSVLERSLGVTGSCVTRIVDERELSKEVRLSYQIDWARPARMSPLFLKRRK